MIAHALYLHAQIHAYCTCSCLKRMSVFWRRRFVAMERRSQWPHPLCPQLKPRPLQPPQRPRLGRVGGKEDWSQQGTSEWGRGGGSEGGREGSSYTSSYTCTCRLWLREIGRNVNICNGYGLRQYAAYACTCTVHNYCTCTCRRDAHVYVHVCGMCTLQVWIHVHVHVHNSYITLIGMHELHGRMHPN